MHTFTFLLSQHTPRLIYISLGLISQKIGKLHKSLELDHRAFSVAVLYLSV